MRQDRTRWVKVHGGCLLIGENADIYVFGCGFELTGQGVHHNHQRDK